MTSETPFTSTTCLNGRLMAVDRTESDKDNKLTYAIRLRQQHRDTRFTEEFTVYTRGEEGKRMLEGVNERDLVLIQAHITKGNSNNTVITADGVDVVEEIEVFERAFELTGQLEECHTKPLGSGPENEEMAELTIVGELNGQEVSVCVKAFMERVATAEGISLGSKVRVTGYVKTHEMGDRQLTSLHLKTIEMVD